MFCVEPALTSQVAARRAGPAVTAVVLGATLIGLAGCGSSGEAAPVSPASGAQSSAPTTPYSASQRRADDASDAIPGVPPGPLRRRRRAAVGIAGGELPEGVTVFNDTYPAITRLDPALLTALREAARDAEADGVQFDVNSGWRSKEYQEQLFERAVSRYGSAAQAAQWVARPGTSVHEAGDAVDLGTDAADAWLARHGTAYGLCQIYDNEPWHYELRLDAAENGCPGMYVDPTDDPRLK